MDVSQNSHFPRFDLRPLFGQNNIVLLVEQQRGFGDLANGYRLAEALVERGNIDPCRIVFVTNDKEGMESFNTLRFKVMDKSEVKNIHNVALQVIVPGYIHRLDHIVLSAPILQLEEYGFAGSIRIHQGSRVRGIAKSMGFNKRYGDDIGVWFNPRFPSFNAPKLHGLSSDFSVFLAGNDPAAFFSKNKLYLGYASDEATKLTWEYVASILEMNQNNEYSLTIVLPQLKKGMFEEREFQCWPEKREKFKAKKLEEFKQYGVGTLIYKIFGSNQTDEEIALSSSAKRLTVVGGKIVPLDMSILWKDSEREALATGDQSVCEAIQARKSIVYESLPHKRDFVSGLCMAYEHICVVNSSFAESKILTQFFLQQQKDHYQKLDLNSAITVLKYDCFPGVVKGIMESLKTPNNIVDFRKNHSLLTPQNIPFKTSCVAFKRDIHEMLRIQEFGWKSLSPLPEFGGSAFSFEEYDSDTVSFERVERPPDQA